MTPTRHTINTATTTTMTMAMAMATRTATATSTTTATMMAAEETAGSDHINKEMAVSGDKTQAQSIIMPL